MFSNELLTKTETLLKAFKQRGQSLATAESCTGGLLGGLITSVSGASAVYLGGVVCYANAEKVRLGVQPTLIDEHGAVSAIVAESLANQVAKACSANTGIGITGIAGPDGGSAEKPVGTVFIAVSGQAAVRHAFRGDRNAIRLAALDAALTQLLTIGLHSGN